MSRIQPNRAFWRAINSFLHPVSIAAVALLIVNDHWLRWQHPSWLTGKLGDFTWLVFAPFIAAAYFAWAIPRRMKHHEKIVGWLSFALIGLWFALAKTTAPVHEITIQLWEAIIGWQGTQRMDATDLLALTGLAVGWWIFWRADNQRIAFRPAATILFALGIVGTLASDGPLHQFMDSGITQICVMGSQLITTTEIEPYVVYQSDPKQEGDYYEPGHYSATPRNFVFRSDDGGFEWDYTINETGMPKSAVCGDSKSSIAIDPDNPSIQYRWQPGKSIERSADGGQTWTLDYELIEMQQDARRYYNHYSETTSYNYGIHNFIVGPVSGIVDPKTGNLVLAMSWDGVLVRTPKGKWEWRAVGSQYRLANLGGFSKLPSILFYELWLAGAVGFLVVTTSTAYMRHRVLRWKKLRYGFLSIGWIAWVVFTVGMLMHSIGLEGDRYTIGIIGFPILILIALPLSFGAVWDIVRNFRANGQPIARVAVGVALLFIAPFIPWTQGTIPRYTTALNFALLLTGAGLLAGFIYLRERLPVLDKPKREATVHPVPIDAGTPSPSGEN